MLWVFIKSASVLLMSTTTYVFVEKSEKYQYFWIEKSALTRAMEPETRKSGVFPNQNVNTFPTAPFLHLISCRGGGGGGGGASMYFPWRNKKYLSAYPSSRVLAKITPYLHNVCYTVIILTLVLLNK